MHDLKQSVSLPSVPWNFMKTIQLIHVSNYGTKQRFSIQHSSMTREEFSKPQGIHPKWTCLHSPSSLSLPASQRPSATAQRLLYRVSWALGRLPAWLLRKVAIKKSKQKSQNVNHLQYNNPKNNTLNISGKTTPKNQTAKITSKR